MAFAAYDAREKMIPWRGRDKDGIRGIYDPGDDQPVATADTPDQLEREAWAYLGREPSADLILIDAENRIHERLINTKYHHEVEMAEQKVANVTIILVFCLTCLVAASLGFFGRWPLVAFVGAIVLYRLFAGIGINQIEAAVPIEILLISSFILIPMFQHSHAKTPEHRVSVMGMTRTIKTKIEG